MAQSTHHPTTEELSAYSLGRLTPDLAQSVEQHVSECLPCCETIVQLSSDDTFVDLLQEVGPSPAQERTQVGDATVDKPDTVPQPLLDHPRYEVLSLIGQGGMGRVYRARHRMMDRAVAIKVINREWVRRPEVIDRFRREVKTAASLDHRNIVTAHDAEHAGDLHFLVMEHVQGVDLAETVRQRGPLPVSEACEYIQQAAGGLQYAHDCGMVHRDIKPHNLIVTPDRVVKILDFGLASLAPQASPEEPLCEDTDGNLTIAGAIMGTPDFISPEQAQDARQVDGRSDIYSLGMTLYYLLAGKVPFDQGTATDKLRQHAESEPPSLSTIRDDVPADLQQLIERMTAKEPADRFQSPEQVRAALQPFLPGEPSQGAAELPCAVERASSSTAPERSRRSGLQVLISVALGGLLALAGLIYLQWNSPQRDRDKLDAFLSSGKSSEPVGDILRRLLRSETGRTYLRGLDARYPKLAYTSGEFSPGYSAVAAVAYEDRVAGTPQPELLVIGSSMTTSGMHQRSLPQELILQSVEFDQAPDDTCQAIFHVITLDDIEFMELKTGSVYESRMGIKDLLGQNGRQSKSLFDAFVAGRYQRKATAAEAKAAQWEFQQDLEPPPPGPRPAVSPLIDRTLTGIRDNTATWVFTWDKVTITSDTPGAPIPAGVAWEVLKSKGEHQQIHASWQLMNRNQEVELFNIKVDGEPSTHEARLPFAAAGKIRVNLGSHQYNCRPTREPQTARLSPQAMTELQTGGGRRASQIAEAVCRAAGISADQWTAFMKDPAAKQQIAGDPLSLVMPMQLATMAGKAPAQLSDLRAAMSLSVSRGYYSLLQPQYITDLAWKVTVQDGEATLNGRVCFNGLGLYAGRVNFQGRCKPGNSDTASAGDVVIEITQFSVPSAGSVITKQDDGKWVLSKVEATGEDQFADDYDLSLVPAAAIEVHGFSPSRLHNDDRFAQLMKHLAISPMNWATLFDGRVEQSLVVKLGDGREGGNATIGLLTIGDGTALEFARSLAADANSDAPASLQLEDALRRPAERFQGRLAFRLLDGRTLAIGDEQDLNALTEMQSAPRDGEFVAASAVLSKSVHQAFSLAKPMDPVWLKQMASESADSPFVPVLLPHLPLVTECSSLVATLSLNETASLSLHVRVASRDKQAVMTKSLQSLTETLRKLSQAIPTGAERVSGSGFLQLTPLASAVLHEALNTATVIEPSDLDSRLVIPLRDVAPQLRPYIESVLTENTSRQSVYEAVSANHLKQLAVAFLLFEQDYGYLPSVKTTLPEAKFPVSWRVALLPYLGEERLYEQYDLNQPWDSPHNKTLLQSTPSFYRHPTQKQDVGGTNYVTIAGPDTATGNGQSPLSMNDVQSGDNPHSTLLLVETVSQIPWTSPQDPTYDEALPLPSLGGIFPHGFQVVMVDGSVHGIPAAVTDEHLGALITRNGQEAVDLDALREAFAAARSGRRAVPQQ